MGILDRLIEAIKPPALKVPVVAKRKRAQRVNIRVVRAIKIKVQAA